MGFTNLVVQPRLGAAVRELSASAHFSRILPVELARSLVRFGLQLRDAFAAQLRLLLCLRGVVGDHQTHIVPARLLDDFFLCSARLLLEVAQNVHKLPITPSEPQQLVLL